MFNEDCRRNWPLIQDVETDAYQILAISFWEIGDGANERCFRLPKFSASFRGRVLSHDGAILFASSFLECS